MVTDLKGWQKRVGTAEITPTSMANGAKELLDEVATRRSPARRTVTRAPTSATSRATSRARRSRTSCSSRSHSRTTRR